MMKTKLSFLAACSFVLCTLFLVACDNGEEALTIWDYSPVVCYVAVEDADGHDLLDPQTEGNILGQDIKADFMGDTYELNAEVVQTRYYLARFTGLQLVYGGDEERYYLRFGELAGENTYENEPLTLHWGDGSTDVITVYNRLLIHAQDDHDKVQSGSDIGEHGGDCGPGHLQAQPENKDWVQQNIQNSPQRHSEAGLGGVPLVNGNLGYYLTSYLPILCLAALASTPLGVTIYRKLPQWAARCVCTILVLAGLVVCTAYLVDGTYNPFLYFRF